MTTLSAAIVLFLILDPLGNIPIFLSQLKELAPRRRRWVMVRELLIALGVLFVFLLCGQQLLDLMHLRQESVSIGGGIILFLIGIKMIFPGREPMFGDSPEGEPFIVPLAIPCVAGPSGVAAVMLLANSNPARTADWSLALLIAWAAAAAIILSSTLLFRVLGMRTLIAAERLMGMLLVALSVQMLLDGFAVYLGMPPAAS
ncbi:MAG: YhgN family NAAT transporter [Xanthomonadales bacterium]|nr:YhgN family NAAT transporter [Xanthomonadales bacterium]